MFEVGNLITVSPNFHFLLLPHIAITSVTIGICGKIDIVTFWEAPILGYITL